MEQLDIYDSDGEQLLTADLIAELIGCKVGTLDSYLSRGQMPAPSGLSGRTRLWSKSIVDEWIASRSPNSIPFELRRIPRWLRYSADKVPLTANGRAASSTNVKTWTSYESAAASKVGAGIGFVLNGDGIMCIDLDHCVVDGVPNQSALGFIGSLPATYIEFSPSGDGLHIWGFGSVTKGTRKLIDGLHVETYSTGRYMTVTNKPYTKAPLAQLT
jgi:predicted DNA-binding transcriptional regulator AlpA